MARPVVLFGLLLTCVAISCDSDSVKPRETTPLVLIEVVDQNGDPMPDLQVGRMNHSSYFYNGEPKLREPNPATPIDFSLPSAGWVTVTVHDYYGQTVAVLADSEYVAAGTHTMSWNDVEDQSPGFYQVRIHFVTETDPVYDWSKWMVIDWPDFIEKSWIGTTDANGLWATDDTLYFPCLLGDPPPIIRQDGFGHVIDTVPDFYNDSITIVIADTTAGQVMQTDTVLTGNRNVFKLTWSPERK